METVRLIISGFEIAFATLCVLGIILSIINFRKNIKLEKEVK